MAEAGVVTRLTAEPVVTPEPKAPAVEVKSTAEQGGTTSVTVAAPEKKLLAGKFETPEALEKGYEELQKKLGEPKTETVTPAPVVTQTAEQQAYSAAVGAAAAKVAGTETEVKATLDWARANASPEEKAMFDAALASGNVQLVETAFGTIRNKYVAAVGSHGNRVTGEPAPVNTGAKPYATRDEMFAVIASKGYKKSDPAVHAEHKRRMEVTKF